LMEALHFFNLDSGLILTFNQRDTLIKEGKRIEMIPVYEYFDNLKS